MDSPLRLQRLRDLLLQVKTNLSIGKTASMLKYEVGYPTSICRAETEKSTAAALFSIVMDLVNRTGYVWIGKPTYPDGKLELKAI